MTDRRKVCLLINGILSKHGINIQLTIYDFKINEIEGVIELKDSRPQLGDKISRYLKENVFKTINPTGKTYYHYLPKLSYLKNILDDGIRLNCLNKYLTNGDTTELVYFLEKNVYFYPHLKNLIRFLKENIFIWSLTEKRDNHEHWEKFADNYNGVAISLEIEFNSQNTTIIDLQKVCYQINFLEEIQEKLYQTFKLQLLAKWFPSYARYCKDKSYEWESEMRLCLDNTFLITNKGTGSVNESNISKYDNLFNIKSENGNSYITVLLYNQFFKIKIKEIFCTQNQYEEIKDLIDQNEIKWIEKLACG
jgi:hypothetical protein